jgi:hypothetical protein
MNPRDPQFPGASLGDSNKRATIKQPRIQQSTTIKMPKAKLLTADQERGLLIDIEENDCLLHEIDFESLSVIRKLSSTVREPNSVKARDETSRSGSIQSND